MKTIFAKSLSEKDRETFAREFYMKDGTPDDLGDNPIPWGMPWLFGYSVELYGSTIEQMVDNYIIDYLLPEIGG